MKFKEYFNVKSIFISKQNDISALNGIRAISVFWVISHHYLLQMQVLFTPDQLTEYMENLAWPLAFLMHGDLGVDIFFILSGFLLTLSILGEQKKGGKIKFKKFYLGRFLRLSPAYFLAIALYFPFLPNTENLWANILQINNFLPYNKMYMVWTWSLAVQEQFYLFLPIFLLLLIKFVDRKLLFLISLFILSFVFRLAAHLANPELLTSHPTDFIFFIKEDYSTLYFDKVYVNLYSRYGPMLLGVILAYLHLNHKEKVKAFFDREILSATVVILAFIGIAWFLNIPHFKVSEVFSETRFLWYSVMSSNLFSLCVAVVMFSIINSHRITFILERFFRLPIWYPVAQISYSMYLFQMFFIASIIFYAADYWKKFPGNDIYAYADSLMYFGFPLSLLMTMCFSLITAILIERPFMSLRKHPRLQF